MKRRKLPGFGSLGVELYDLDLRTIDTEGMVEIGRINLDQLLCVIKKEHVGISLERFHHICGSWVEPESDFDFGKHTYAKMMAKYASGDSEAPPDLDAMDAEDRLLFEESGRIRKGIEHLRGMSRVTGIRDEHGNTTGMFADGELEWHCNNQGADRRAPVVALLGAQGTAGSTTEFLNTVDAYRDLSSDWRQLCDGLVAIHRWKPGELAPGLSPVQERLLRYNMCPDDDVEVPLVMQSPGGLRGLHFAFTSISHFRGRSHEESQALIAELKQLVIRDEYVYRHEWEDGDLLFFDNTITLHRRPTKDCSKRLMYPMAFNCDRVLRQRGAGAAAAGNAG